MGKRVLSLGVPAAGTNPGITISTGTNATPIVATFGAGHGLVDDDRINITGVTTLTNMNGIWTLKFTGTNTAQLVGSVGNGAFGGTAEVGVVCDRTPFMANKSAMAIYGGGITAGSVAVQGSDTGANGTYATIGVAESIPVGGLVREVKLKRFMRCAGTVSTTGTCPVNLVPGI